MAKPMTTCQLLTDALRTALVPSDQATFTCCDLLDIMNKEMGVHVMPVVMKAHEEHYVIEEDVPICTCVVTYKIPYRAVGNKLRDVQYVNSAGVRFEMTRLSPEDRPSCQNKYYNNNILSFDLQGDEVVLFCKPTVSGDLRMLYYIRPNELVKVSRGARISAVSICSCCCTTTFTVCCVPSHFPCTTVFDFIQGKSPNKILTFDSCVTSICQTAKTITFANAQLTRVDTMSGGTKAVTFNVGDYIMKSEETIYPQGPAEVHPLVSQRTAVKLLEALGDTEGMKNAQQELDRMEHNLMTLIDNRVEGAPQKIRNNNSILKQVVTNKRGY
jgi:hypothetical protein